MEEWILLKNRMEAQIILILIRLLKSQI